MSQRLRALAGPKEGEVMERGIVVGMISLCLLVVTLVTWTVYLAATCNRWEADGGMSCTTIGATTTCTATQRCVDR